VFKFKLRKTYASVTEKLGKACVPSEYIR